MMKKENITVLISITFILLVSGCTGPLVTNPMLETARSEFESAERDSSILIYAPVALKEAEEELQESIRFWEAREDKVLVDHHSYLAKQKTAIARETAKLNQAQIEIERAEPERQKVLIEIRRNDAVRAEDRARTALAEARQERMEADRARERAEELTRRVEELEAERTVEKLAEFMTEYPERNLLIEGFTDNIGTDGYNEDLSRKRSDAVRQALLNRGISSNRIEVIGYGKRFPVANNSTESGRQQNRRVEVIISDRDGNIPRRVN